MIFMKFTVGSSNAAKRAQGALQQRSRGLCGASWVSKIAPRAPPETFKRAQEASKSFPEVAKSAPEGPQKSPRAVQIALNAAKTDPRPPKRPPRGPLDPPGGLQNMISEPSRGAMAA